MDWIENLQNAIDYIEENITQKIDYEEVAKRAYSSTFHFQRVFGRMGTGKTYRYLFADRKKQKIKIMINV